MDSSGTFFDRFRFVAPPAGYWNRGKHTDMSAIFSFTSWITVALLFICASAFLHRRIGPYKYGDPQTKGFTGVFWKAARIGERLSPWVSLGCFAMAAHTVFIGR